MSTQRGPHTLPEQCECDSSWNESQAISKEKIAEPLLILQREHISILHECALMVAAVKNVNPIKKAENTSSLGAAVQIRKLRAILVEHASREEQILIPIVSKVLGAEATTSIKKEHEQIIELLRALEKNAPSETGAHDTYTNPTLIGLAAEFQSLLREHFSREENVLFWFASLHIPKS